jgi:hypothetical protein
MTKTARPTVTKSKKKAWDAYSKYIRLRDSLLTTKTKTSCVCITCKNTYPTWGVGCIQAGHWIPGRHATLLFDERNCHGQCHVCNKWRRGEYGKYTRAMKELYGQAVMDELLALDAQTPIPIKVFEYQEIEQLYKEAFKQLDSSY